MLKTTFRSAMILALAALLCTAISIAVYLLTKQRIETVALQQQQQLLSQVVPAELFDQPLLQHCIIPDKAHYPTLQQIYIAQKHGKTTAYAIKVTTNKGYSGRIDMLIGITIHGKILGVRVLQHNETPGLGDKIETSKSDWIYHFDQLLFDPAMQNQWAVKKDGGQFDQFTGATITPRAIVNSVKQTALTVLNEFSMQPPIQVNTCQ